eukprot:COSAG02_NODE_747_length_17723_cov_49.509816_6_plen_80_part_00
MFDACAQAKCASAHTQGVRLCGFGFRQKDTCTHTHREREREPVTATRTHEQHQCAEARECSFSMTEGDRAGGGLGAPLV